MAFEKSAPAGRPTEFGHVRWNMKDKSIPSPNIEFYDAKTKTSRFMLGAEDRPGINVSGRLVNATAFAREGYNDRLKKNGEKNEWRLMLVLDDGGPQLSALTMDLISDTGVPNSHTMDLLNAVVTHLENGGKDTPIQIGLYRRKDKNDAERTYPASSIRLPSNDDMDNPQFDDWQNFVRTESFPPRGEPVIVNGVHFEANGIKQYDYANVRDWASEMMSKLVSHFPKKDANIEAEAEKSTNPESAPEEGVELAEAVNEAVDAAPRERHAG